LSETSDWIAGRDDIAQNTFIRIGASSLMEQAESVEKPEVQQSARSFGSRDSDQTQASEGSKGQASKKISGSYLEDAEPSTIDLGIAPAQETMDEEAPADEETAPAEEETSPCCILHGPRMDEEHILKDGQWCCYVLCGGLGWLEETKSPCHFFTKCICIQHACEMVEHETREGVCGAMQTCCFCTPMFQCPPPEGTPRCICCGAMFGGLQRLEPVNKKEQKIEDDPYTLFEHVSHEHFQPCFCLCCGVGCQPFFQSVYDAYFKCLCCKYSVSVVPPCEEEGINLCNLVVNAGTCLAQCRYPLKFTGNPLCACCGKRCKKHSLHMPGTK